MRHYVRQSDRNERRDELAGERTPASPQAFGRADCGEEGESHRDHDADKPGKVEQGADEIREPGRVGGEA